MLRVDGIRLSCHAGNGGQHHNLQQYIYNIDQTRDIALMNKVRRTLQ